MKKWKKYACIGCLFVFAICVIVIVDHKKTKSPVQDKTTTDVRKDYDILRAGELDMNRVTDQYLLSVEELLENGSEGEQVKEMIRSVGSRLVHKKTGRLYVSKQPVYFWDAGQSQVYEKQVLLMVFDESLSRIGCCKLQMDYDSSGKKRTISDNEGSVYQDAKYLLKDKSQEFAYVSVESDKTPFWREDLLMDDKSSIVTGTGGWGSFSVTAKGDYFGALRKVEGMTFSYNNLTKKQNLIEIEW